MPENWHTYVQHHPGSVCYSSPETQTNYVTDMVSETVQNCIDELTTASPHLMCAYRSPALQVEAHLFCWRYMIVLWGFPLLLPFRV